MSVGVGVASTGAGRTFTVRLPYDASAAAEARRLVKTLLAGLPLSSRLVDDATLVVHELVINGLIHGGPSPDDRIHVAGTVTSDELFLMVQDFGTSGIVAARRFTSDGISGRGLALVSALCRRWDVDRSAGTCVSAWLSL